MKSLDQIASTGIVINAVNTPGDTDDVFVISQAGNYFLSGNVTVPSGKTGIEVTAAGVTIDLNGFQITGPGSGSFSTGIYVPSANNCAIKNGSITNFSANNSAGVFCHANGAIISNLSLSNCFGGIELFGTDAAVVRSCTATNCPFAGVLISGGGGVVTDCTVSHVTGALAFFGIEVGSGATVTNCAVYSNA